MGILDNFSLEGKVALVTGASYGIGFAIATAFAEAGATIVMTFSTAIWSKERLIVQTKRASIPHSKTLKS